MNIHAYSKKPYIMKKFETKAGIKKISDSKSLNPYNCRCKNCGKIFDGSSKLALHLISHIRKFPDNYEPELGCEKKSQDSVLKNYILIHVEDKGQVSDANVDSGVHPKETVIRVIEPTVHSINELTNVDRIHLQDIASADKLQKDFKQTTKKHVLQIQNEKPKKIESGSPKVGVYEGPKLHVCQHDNCCEVLKNSRQLDVRTKVRIRERPFAPKDDLKRHVLTHSEKRPHSCDWSGCGKKFTRKWHLKNHMLLHTGKRPHNCEWPGCDKKFTLKRYLNEHVLVHSKKRSFVCEWPGCGKNFFKKTDLNSHKLNHSVKNNVCVIKNRKKSSHQYWCPFCQTAKSRGQKTGDIEGTQLHDCHVEDCGKIFKSPEDLAMHLKTHTKECSYSCEWPVWNEKFTQESNSKKCMLINTKKVKYNQIKGSEQEKIEASESKTFFKCNYEVDGKYSDNTFKLESHPASHIKERHYVCSQKSELKNNHVSINTQGCYNNFENKQYSEKRLEQIPELADFSIRDLPIFILGVDDIKLMNVVSVDEPQAQFVEKPAESQSTAQQLSSYQGWPENLDYFNPEEIEIKMEYA